ncbi:MAG: hypothetical protein WAM39_03935 [Bryobacteraceae bacterium]
MVFAAALVWFALLLQSYLIVVRVLASGLPGRYLYPFIDAGAIGYGRTLGNAVILSCAFLGVSLVVVAIGRVVRGER